MAFSLQPVRGMQDLMPADYARHKLIISKTSQIAGLDGFQEMSTPLVEYREVFDRTGETLRRPKKCTPS